VTDQARFLAGVRARLDGAPRTPLEIPAGWAALVDDTRQRFEVELTGAGGHFHRASWEELPAAVARIVGARSRAAVVITPGVPHEVASALEEAGARVTWWPEADRDRVARADFGITGALWGAAETGSVLVSSAPPEGRAPSLLPRVHIALLSARRLVPTVAALFARIAAMPERPSNLVLVTGPSKTGDIENQLVTGVHGPVEAHVVVVDDDA
jgi:L-lactate dehydrogenase complex protein LldG